MADVSINSSNLISVATSIGLDLVGPSHLQWCFLLSSRASYIRRMFFAPEEDASVSRMDVPDPPYCL